MEVLVAQQRRQRLLMLRAVLDAVAEAPAAVLPPAAAGRVLADWRLLAAAERADPEAAHRVVHYPMTGAWAERALRDLTTPGGRPRTATVAYLGATAAAAAARAGLRFTAEVPVRDGLLTLPTLGACTVPAGCTSVGVTGDGSRLWLHLPPPGGRPRRVEVRRGPDGVWRSAAAGWRPIRALSAAGARPVLIDDADPHRDEERRADPYGLTVADALGAGQHARWRTAWDDARPWLDLGGERAQGVGALLDCFVPLTRSATAHSSATRGDAFGALLSSTPSSGLELATTLVHELQHTRLLALSALTVLHNADDTPRYWAPWRPDPRPFDGLFQGAYAHLGLSDFHLRVALSAASPSVRDAAWADHCRCRQQVEAAMPQLLGCSRLTRQGRILVTAMAEHHRRLKEKRPPEGHLARATAYVETARVIWRRGRA
ncbi:HEXXH motif domain-containing protein [Streptomyces bryophytorum]|nr:HEXXH motif domain-containing protein [Actinacidiphila bryophytorum]